MNISEDQILTWLIRRKRVGCTLCDTNQPLGVSLLASQPSKLLKWPRCASEALCWHLNLLSLVVIPEKFWSLRHYDMYLPFTSTPRPHSYHRHTYLGGGLTPLLAPLRRPLITGPLSRPQCGHGTEAGQAESLSGESEFWAENKTKGRLIAAPPRKDPQMPQWIRAAGSLDSVVHLFL